jgi:Protein of unknown function (DUF1091)
MILFYKQFHIENIASELKFNSEFLRVTHNLHNQTHLGAIRAEIFKDLPNLYFQFKSEIKGKRPIEFFVNLCKWMKNRRANTLILFWTNFFENFMDPFECPIKKGNYTILDARDNHLNDKSVEGIAPIFFAMKGNNVTLTLTFKAKIAKKMELLYQSIEVFRFR